MPIRQFFEVAIALSETHMVSGEFQNEGLLPLALIGR